MGFVPSGFKTDWHVGVVVADHARNLVGFISAIPVTVSVRGENIQMAQVNFLCLHKKYISKQIAPSLMKEISRRVALDNVKVALHTIYVGTYYAPMATCKVWHRPLNPIKLIDAQFLTFPKSPIRGAALKLYRLPTSTVTRGLRVMEAKDVPALTSLLKTYLGKFTIAASFDETEVEHWFLPRPDIVESYVVESANQNITYFISFTIIPTSVKGGSTLKSADSFYIVSSTTTPRDQLLKDALILAKEKDIDVFIAIAIMDNTDALLRDLRFKEDEQMKYYYYLYNYRLKEGVKPSEIGLVMV